MNLKHWETTALGVLIILVTLAHAAFTYMITKQLPDISVTITGIAIGVACIRGADASAVDKAIAALKVQFGEQDKAVKK